VSEVFLVLNGLLEDGFVLCEPGPVREKEEEVNVVFTQFFNGIGKFLHK